MAITVTHTKVSLKPDDSDESLIRPSDWNATHALSGTVPVANGGTGAATLTGYVYGNGTSAMTASTTVPNTAITGLGTMSTQNANAIAVTGGSMSGVTISDYIPTTQKAAALGVATLDSSTKVPISQIPDAVIGALSYQGTWDASTNTPTLTSSVGTKGYYYVVSVSGSTNLNGVTDWLVGDWAVYNGTAWQKVDNTDSVTSVNGLTGAVVLTQANISGTVPTTLTLTAGTGLTGGGDLSANRTFAIDSTVATLTGTQTLTNKTITAPKIDLINDTNGNEILGLSPTTSATDYLVVKNGIGVGVPLHIYADGSSTNTGMHIQPKGTGLVTISDGTDFNKGIRFRSSGSAASAVTLLDAVATAGRVVTLPDATTTLVGRDTTDTLTNKSISGSTNTLSNIGNSSLTNSAITINGTSTNLGGSISVGTVTSVTGTAPVVSSGGATPAISMPAATSSVDGYLTSTDWNTFNSKGSGTVTSVSATAPITSSGGATPNLAMPAATTSVNGYLTSTDWTTFNNKGSGTVTSVTGTAPVVSSGGATPAISMAAATTSVSGYLTSTDWTTFNGKQAALVSGTNIKTVNGNTLLGSGNLAVTASAAGSTTQVQYNSSGSFAGSSNLTFDGTNLTVGGITNTEKLAIGTTQLGAGNSTRFKNRIINGNMRIDQRNAGASVTPATGNTYLVDRFYVLTSQSSKFTAQQNAGSVTPPAGFTNYLGITSSSAYSVAAGDYFNFVQRIEGLNIADLSWGTADAKTVTLSFWVRSSLTGTFGGSLQNSASNRSYPFNYTISSANTWTQISVTIAGDTSGTWLTTNGIGISVYFGLGVGSTYSGTASAWAASNYVSSTSATSVVGTSGATFYITGVQLEVGSSATGFEYVDYGTQLNLCQRYYETTAALTGLIVSMYSTGSGYGAYYYRVTKRATPTVTNASIGTFTVYCASATYGVASFGNTAATNMCSVGVNLSSAVPSNGYSSIVSSSDANSMMFSAEL